MRAAARYLTITCGVLLGLAPLAALAQDPAPVQFLEDIAPILIESCVGCHNVRKAESKYDMSTFARLAKGGAVGEDITLEPGKPDESYFVELLRHDADPRMPYKQDPLPAEQIALIERWVSEGATYDGPDPNADWVALVNARTPVTIPERYPVAVPVTALAFAPDGQALLASGYHELTRWSTADGTLASRARTLPERTYDLAFRPDGKALAVAAGTPGQNGVVRVWPIGDDGALAEPRDLVESTDAVFAVAFSPDGKTLAAAGADRAIRLWDTETYTLQATIEDHADWILDLAFSPDSARLASASRDKTAKVFDVAAREALVTFPGHGNTVHAVAFTPDGKQIASAGEDARIRLWTPEDEAKQTAELGGFGGAVFAIAYAPDGTDLVAVSADKVVRVFRDNQQRLALSGHKDWIYTLAISRDGNTIASGGWDGEIRLWNRADGAPGRIILAAPGLEPAQTAQATP